MGESGGVLPMTKRGDWIEFRGTLVGEAPGYPGYVELSAHDGALVRVACNDYRITRKKIEVRIGGNAKILRQPTSQQSPIAWVKFILHGRVHRTTEEDAARIADDILGQLKAKMLGCKGCKKQQECEKDKEGKS